MPNRIIKESICTSESIDELGWFEEVFFYRLMVNVDDYGRLDARPAILKAKLFPLKNVTLKQVEQALIKLSTAGMVLVYEYDRKPFLQLCAWSKHQQIRNQKSKYPSPDEKNSQLMTIEINCNQLQSNVPVIQSESNPNPESNPNMRKSAGEGFDEFWAAYPKKRSKPAAEKAFLKIKPTSEQLKVMLEALARLKNSEEWSKANGQYIPYPASWLNQRRWEDEDESNSATRTNRTSGSTPSKYDNLNFDKLS